MKTKRAAAGVFIAALISFFVGCGPSGGSGNSGSNASKTDSPATRGEQIVAEYLKRDAAPFRKMRVRFTVNSDDGTSEVYELDAYRKQVPGEIDTLTQIVRSPENDELASLTVEASGKKTVVTTYAVSRDEFRETDTNKMFIGGLTAGELLGEWDKYDYRLLSERDQDGRKVFDVEGKLKSTAGSPIAKMDVLFAADNYLPVELHLFDPSGKEIRTCKVTESKDDAKGPYAAKTEVDNPIRKAHITIEVLGREFPATIDDSIFTREKLKQVVRK